MQKVYILGIGMMLASIGAVASDSIRVYIFLSESCPICQSVTLELKRLYLEYEKKGVTFIGLFPNQDRSDEASRAAFQKKYNLPFALVEDQNQTKVKAYQATATPEVIVVRQGDSRVLYRGRVDNSFESLGHRRAVVNERYLSDALASIYGHQPVKVAVTKPVGCFISKI